MNGPMIFLRLVHILGGVFWVGCALAMTFFIAPTAAATAEAGQKFMGHLMTQTRLTLIITTAALSTVLAGFALYWIDSAGFTLRAWMESGTGTGFAIGAIFALVGLHFGLQVPRIAGALGKLGAQIQGSPTAEQAAQLTLLRRKQVRVSLLNSSFLLLATFFMAIARYLRF